MSSNQAISYLQGVVNEIMRKKMVENYDVEIEGSSGVTDGYLGEIIFFNVTENGNGKKKFVLKTTKKNDFLRRQIPLEKFYDREITIYSDLFPNLERFTTQKNMRGFLNFVPRAIFTSKVPQEESVILENLQQLNYSHCDRRKPLNLAHIQMVFETYGKWHGLVMAYRNLNNAEFSKLVKEWKDTRILAIEVFGCSEDFREDFEIMLRMLEENNRRDLLEYFEGVHENFENILFRKTYEEDVLCITHGDCWLNNYMFKYDKKQSSKPSNVCLLDFQLSAIDTPILDLSLFLYSTADKTAFLHFDELLNVYHDSLSKTWTSLGCDVSQLLSIFDPLQYLVFLSSIYIAAELSPMAGFDASGLFLQLVKVVEKYFRIFLSFFDFEDPRNTCGKKFSAVSWTVRTVEQIVDLRIMERHFTYSSEPDLMYQ